MAEVVFTSEARDQAATLPRAVMARVEKLFKRLRNWPAVSGAKPLTGNLAGRFRFQLMAADHRPHGRRFKSGCFLLFASPGKNLEATGWHLPQQ
jgi:hypothetical protein